MSQDSFHLDLLRGEIRYVTLAASDEMDGYSVRLMLNPGKAVTSLSRTSSDMTAGCEMTLNTGALGNFSISVKAFDGELYTDEIVVSFSVWEVLPTATPVPPVTPTSTATLTPSPVPTIPFEAFIVTDDVHSYDDLSNNQDRDTVVTRSLVLRWNLNPAEVNLADVADIHVYVRINQEGNYIYLGRTASGISQSFEWSSGARLLAPIYRSGPQFGYRYEFMFYALTASKTPRYYGPYRNRGAVQYVEEPS